MEVRVEVRGAVRVGGATVNVEREVKFVLSRDWLSTLPVVNPLIIWMKRSRSPPCAESGSTKDPDQA